MFKTIDWLENGSDHSFYLIGDEERQAYYLAIIGLAKDKSHVAYSFEKLVRCYMKQNGWSYDEAEEWVEYNVERSLPYYGEHAPVILDVQRINRTNRKYDPLTIIT